MVYAACRRKVVPPAYIGCGRRVALHLPERVVVDRVLRHVGPMLCGWRTILAEVECQELDLDDAVVVGDGAEGRR